MLSVVKTFLRGLGLDAGRLYQKLSAASIKADLFMSFEMVERLPQRMTAEEVHVLEPSPEDWTLLARFAGYKPVFRRIYRQYPRYSPLRLTQPLWEKLDSEAFLMLFLERDLSFASRYADW